MDFKRSAVILHGFLCVVVVQWRFRVTPDAQISVRSRLAASQTQMLSS